MLDDVSALLAPTSDTASRWDAVLNLLPTWSQLFLEAILVLSALVLAMIVLPLLQEHREAMSPRIAHQASL